MPIYEHLSRGFGNLATLVAYVIFLVEFQKWLNALSEHIGFSTHYTHQGEAQSEYAEDIVPLGTMQEALQVCSVLYCLHSYLWCGQVETIEFTRQ